MEVYTVVSSKIKKKSQSVAGYRKLPLWDKFVLALVRTSEDKDVGAFLGRHI